MKFYVGPVGPRGSELALWKAFYKSKMSMHKCVFQFIGPAYTAGSRKSVCSGDDFYFACLENVPIYIVLPIDHVKS